ncbi:S1 family peptidase [Mechercharimyces sp. CAU 1602]|uniref:S1 family peptidase n=1 Tax=Mechercharimyces sp. CAU 1602 TaxID=2973933 RepID=UPI0021632358|nr:S1 family peptidase [Mechercharimyces sp. CAU 1602]MCS1351282.1 S1 family peptidase [Mechercharimyces sp. CAU 1602]
MATFYAATLVKNKLVSLLMKYPTINAIGIGAVDMLAPLSQMEACVNVYTTSATVQTNMPKSITVLAEGRSEAVQVITRPATTFSMGNRGSLGQTFGFAANQGVPNASSRFTERIRPAIAGYSVGESEDAGTLGLVVTEQNQPGELFIFSNNHVLVFSNQGRALTYQPGGFDQAPSAATLIGSVNSFLSLDEVGSNLVDVATAQPFRSSDLAPLYATVGEVPGWVTAFQVGDRLKKVGRTTGAVSGVVEAVNVTARVDYTEDQLGILLFNKQTLIRADQFGQQIDLPGDSGSCWLREDNNLAAAVNFAGEATPGGTLSLSYNVDWALEALGLAVARINGSAGQRVEVQRSPNFFAFTPPLTPSERAQLRSRVIRFS